LKSKAGVATAAGRQLASPARPGDACGGSLPTDFEKHRIRCGCGWRSAAKENNLFHILSVHVGCIYTPQGLLLKNIIQPVC
jgi:hypothetical protein